MKTSTVVSHWSFEEIFSMARRTRPDAVLMGWSDDDLWSAARTERPIAELANQLPCDFLVLNDRGLDASRVLVPTAGGPDSGLGAEVARGLSRTVGAEVTLLHVVAENADREAAEEFLEEWAGEHGLEDAAQSIDDGGDVEDAIERAAADHTLVIIGATEKGLLSRLVSDSLHLNVVKRIDCSVLLAERPGHRSLRSRLFGEGRRERDVDSVAAEPETGDDDAGARSFDDR